MSSPEVVARISQAKREFATYQRRLSRGLAAARGGGPAVPHDVVLTVLHHWELSDREYRYISG